MIIPDLKRHATTIMARRTAKGEALTAPAPMKPELSETAPGEPDPRHIAAQDMLSAFHEKSAEKLKTAMGNFIDLHGLKKDAGEPEPS